MEEGNRNREPQAGCSTSGRTYTQRMEAAARASPRPRDSFARFDLREARDARPRDGAHRKRSPFVGRRAEVFLGVERLLEADRLAGVGRHARHDRHQRALAHVVAVVDRFVGADGGEERVVLVLVHVVRLVAAPAPGVLAVDLVRLQVRCAVAAEDVIGDIARRAVPLTARAEAAHAVLPLEDRVEVVVDVPVLLLVAHGAAAAGGDLDGIAVHHPGDLVEAVDVLLGDVVAGEPVEVEPVADLVLHVAPVLLAALVPQAARVVGRLERGDVADRAIMDAAHGLLLGELIAVAEARDDREALLASLLAGGHHRAHAGAVGGDRLLDEQVLARFDRGRDVQRTEVRRGGEQHDVAAVDHALVGVEADEAVLGIDVDLGRDVGAVLQCAQAAVDLIGEGVAERHELGVRVGAQRVLRRAGAAPAAADQTDAQHVRAAGLPAARKGVGHRGAGGREGRAGAEDIATGEGVAQNAARRAGHEDPLRDSGVRAWEPLPVLGRPRVYHSRAERNRAKPLVTSCSSPPSATMRPSAPRTPSSSANPASGPKTQTAEANASALIPSAAITVAPMRRASPSPVRGSMMCE